jgi:YfiR/HmsC-like
LLLTVLLSASAVVSAPAQVSPSNEYAVKAAFLFHFAQFVEWPPSALRDSNAPFVFCTLGDDPFQGALEETITGKTIGNRLVRVFHARQLQDTQNCQILFIPASEKKHLPAILAWLKNSPVLTVGEAASFAQDGGMIGFCLEDKKIRFEINLAAADHAGLKISSRLLALAKSVMGGSRGI